MGLLFSVIISRDELRELCGLALECDGEKLKHVLSRIKHVLGWGRQFDMLEPSSRHNRN
jgi:hypothetical protein